MLILISINVQYLQKAVFSSEKGSNGQVNGYTSSGPHHPIKKIPQPKVSKYMEFLDAWKSCVIVGILQQLLLKICQIDCLIC